MQLLPKGETYCRETLRGSECACGCAGVLTIGCVCFTENDLIALFCVNSV